MDIHNSFMDIHKSIMDIHKLIMDIHNSGVLSPLALHTFVVSKRQRCVYKWKKTCL